MSESKLMGEIRISNVIDSIMGKKLLHSFISQSVSQYLISNINEFLHQKEFVLLSATWMLCCNFKFQLHSSQYLVLHQRIRQLASYDISALGMKSSTSCQSGHFVIRTILSNLIKDNKTQCIHTIVRFCLLPVAKYAEEGSAFHCFKTKHVKRSRDILPFPHFGELDRAMQYYEMNSFARWVLA